MADDKQIMTLTLDQLDLILDDTNHWNVRLPTVWLLEAAMSLAVR